MLRSPVIETLHLVAAPLLQHLGLIFGLDTFGGDDHVQRLAKAHDRGNDGAGLRADPKRIDKGAIDLDLLYREARQIGQARIASAEIVHGDGNANLIEPRQGLDHRVGILQKRGFGNFQLQAVRLKSGFGKHLLDECLDILGLELRRRKVDGQVKSRSQVAA